jgi:hypothetical protein
VRRFAPQLFAQLLRITVMLFCLSNAHGQIGHRRVSQEIPNRDLVGVGVHQDFNERVARQKWLEQLSLRNDFRKLQIVNNRLMVRMFVPSSSPQRISNKEIRSSLGEIKKIAERLKSNLIVPKVESVEEANQVALAPGLLLLDDAVMSFVHNPLFHERRVYDAELASRAGRDLNEVLRLAKVLRKLTEED